jgi:hypothetical protein
MCGSEKKEKGRRRKEKGKRIKAVRAATQLLVSTAFSL